MAFGGWPSLRQVPEIHPYSMHERNRPWKLAGRGSTAGKNETTTGDASELVRVFLGGILVAFWGLALTKGD